MTRKGIETYQHNPMVYICARIYAWLSRSKLFFARTEWMYIFVLKTTWSIVMLLPAICDGLHLVFTFFFVLSPHIVFFLFRIDIDFTQIHAQTNTHNVHTRARFYTFWTKFFFCVCFYETRQYRFTKISCQKHFEAKYSCDPTYKSFGYLPKPCLDTSFVT